jgi:hypothetical protein
VLTIAHIATTTQHKKHKQQKATRAEMMHTYKIYDTNRHVTAWLALVSADA